LHILRGEIKEKGVFLSLLVLPYNDFKLKSFEHDYVTNNKFKRTL